MRIAVHDYAGHPFQFDLSRELARRGHVVRHYYFAEDIGPKGRSAKAPDDPETFSVEPLSIGMAFSKSDFIRRRNGDIQYGKVASAALRAFRPDLVISGNTPLEAQQRIQRACELMGAKFVFWMQDFYSLAIERIIGSRWMGLGRKISNYYKKMEIDILRESDGVVLISENFKPQIQSFGVDLNRVSVIPNWGALDDIPQYGKENPWSCERSLADNFVFLYSGTLALKHNPHLLWALADSFRSDPEVRVVVAASGVSADAIRERQQREPLPNLVLLPLQPMDAFPQMLGAADVLVALLENDAGEFSVPSKVLSYLCAGRPVLLSAPLLNSASAMVKNAGAGLCVAPLDVEGFIAAAHRLREDARARASMGQAARAYAEKTFDIKAVGTEFEHVFARACGREPAAPQPALV